MQDGQVGGVVRGLAQAQRDEAAGQIEPVPLEPLPQDAAAAEVADRGRAPCRRSRPRIAASISSGLGTPGTIPIVISNAP